VTPLPRPAISVVVPHLNQPDALAACLACLRAQSLAPELVEIIVVDNGSQSSPETAIRGFPEVVLAREPRPGPGLARNRGAVLARAPILAFTDADCLPEPGWAAAILARFEADPSLSILGGEVRVAIATPGRPTMAEAFEQLFAFRQRRQIARAGFSVTANLAVRREALDAVGPFGGIEVSEDLDWGRRAHALGFLTVFAPEAVVAHPARRSMAALRDKWGRHVAHFYRLHSGRRGRLRWALTIPLMALSPLAELPVVLFSGRIAGPRTRALAFAGLVQIRLFRAWRMLRAMREGDGALGRLRWNPPGPSAPGPR
jgi:GT2 family glycosyltransferase